MRLWPPHVPLNGGETWMDQQSANQKLDRDGRIMLVVGVVFVVSLSVAVYWNHHTSTPEYRIGKRFEAAQTALEAGRVADAMDHLRAAAESRTSWREPAREKLFGMASPSALDAMPAGDAAAVIGAAHDLQPEVVDTAFAMLDNLVDVDPAGGIAIVNTLEELVGEARQEELGRRRLELTEAWVEAEPGNLEPAVALALLLEPQGEVDRIEALLAPHASSLGEGEGARVLGQIYAFRNRVDEAFDLLAPYAERRLAAFHAAEQAYDAVLDDVWNETLAYLDSGAAPDTFYQDYEAADETGQYALIHAFYVERRDSSPEVEARLATYLEAAKIVPVAMDLGTVLLHQAQVQADAEVRQAQLRRAEQTFLAIQGIASESDEYRLYLGQVYYWLGNQDEGRALFQDLIESNQRSAAVLFSVASLLRDLGAEAEARELAEEAYEKSEPETGGYAVAKFLSLLGASIEDSVRWLERADPNDLSVRADLEYYAGRIAADEGDEAKALAHYQAALEHLSGLSESAHKHNEMALIRNAQYALSADLSDLEASLALLDRAVELEGSDAITVYNAASQHLKYAYSQLFAEYVDLTEAPVSPGRDALRYLYADHVERQALADRLRANPSLGKAISYLQRSMMLSPNNPAPYSDAANLFLLLDDDDGLAVVARQLENANLDLSEEESDYQLYLAAETAETLAAARESQIEYLSAELKKREGQDLVGSMLVGLLVEAEVQRAAVAKMTVSEDILHQARLTYEAFPSIKSHLGLSSLLLQRAAHWLADNDDAFALAYEEHGPTLGPKRLLTLAMQGSTTWRRALLANEDFREYLTLLYREMEAFPSSPSAQDWAILRYADPDRAGNVASSLAASERSRLLELIGARSNLRTPATLLDRYWFKLATGDAAGAEAILKQVAQAGVKLPLKAI